MMKNNFILLLALITAILVGCKPKNIDVNEALKQISEETFAQTPSRSYLSVKDNNLQVVEYTFDVTKKTAVRKEVVLAQTALFTGEKVENFTYTWGEFKESMYGRSLCLKGDQGNRDLVYLNDQLNDGSIVTAIKEPRADMVDNMVSGLMAGEWNAEKPTYVLQLIWRDSFVVNWVMKKKKLVPDTVPMRIPLDKRDTIGVDSCLYYTYAFLNGATNKEAKKVTEIKRNIVTPDTTFLPKLNDPSKNDTIVKYSVVDGVKEPLSEINYAFWSIADISTKGDVQNMDVKVGETGKDPETLSLSAFAFDGTKGSFVLNDMTFILKPKN